MSADQFIAGIHARLGKASTFNMDAKLKGHVFLRPASLSLQDHNMETGICELQLQRHLHNLGNL